MRPEKSSAHAPLGPDRTRGVCVHRDPHSDCARARSWQRGDRVGSELERRRRPSALSAQQLAGQRVIFSYAGLTPPPALLAKIRAGEAAGVIFFKGNISSDAQIKAVISQLQHAAAQSPVKEPLLMMTDQEGGQVRRLPGAPVLSEKQIGESI